MITLITKYTLENLLHKFGLKIEHKGSNVFLLLGFYLQIHPIAN